MHEQTHLLGGQKGAPLMLLPSAAAAEEACILLLGSSSAAPTASIRTVASSPSSSSFMLDLGCWVEAACPSSPQSSPVIRTAGLASTARLLSMGLRLLSHSIRHCLPGCATAIMDIISTRLGITPQELLHSVTMPVWFCGSIDPPSLPLLHLAVQGGNLPLIHSLLAWAELHSVRPDWTVAGPSGICPLHLAALLPNAVAVVRGMLALPRPYGPDIAAAWLLCRSSDGRTPAELGSSVNLPASLDNLAHDALVRASDEEPSFEIGVNPGSVAKSVSSASGASGIAVMASTLTGEEGIGASCMARQLLVAEGVLPSPQAHPSACASIASRVSSGGAEESNSSSVQQPLVDDPPRSSFWLNWGGAGVSSSDVGSGASRFSSRVAPSKETGGPASSVAAAKPAAPYPCRGALFRLLWHGFPDAGAEARYAEFKVRQERESGEALRCWLLGGGQWQEGPSIFLPVGNGS